MSCPRHLIVTLGCAVALLSPLAAAAQALDTTGATPCEVRGWARDPDPRGTNVRSAPRDGAPIIGHVAAMVRIAPDEITGTEFDIVAFKDGWLLIRDGSDSGLTFDPAHAADGRGWISATLVGAQLRTIAFRSAPHRDAPQIAHLAGDNWGPDSVKVSAVHGCRGGYIEVTATPIGGKPLRGWSYKPCSLQLTTCDGGITEQ
jgi:hypothetical protein